MIFEALLFWTSATWYEIPSKKHAILNRPVNSQMFVILNRNSYFIKTWIHLSTDAIAFFSLLLIWILSHLSFTPAQDIEDQFLHFAFIKPFHAFSIKSNDIKCSYSQSIIRLKDTRKPFGLKTIGLNPFEM